MARADGADAALPGAQLNSMQCWMRPCRDTVARLRIGVDRKGGGGEFSRSARWTAAEANARWLAVQAESGQPRSPSVHEGGPRRMENGGPAAVEGSMGVNAKRLRHRRPDDAHAHAQLSRAARGRSRLAEQEVASKSVRHCKARRGWESRHGWEFQLPHVRRFWLRHAEQRIGDENPQDRPTQLEWSGSKRIRASDS